MCPCLQPDKHDHQRPVLQATHKAAPQHAAVWEDSTLRTLLSLYMPHLRLEGQTMKLQANAGEQS